MQPLPRSFFQDDAVAVAPTLLNKVLVNGETAGRIVEVEAYLGSEDPASHAYRGKTARNAVMFGPAGHLYVYFTYGMHHCCNVVCGPAGNAGAVLIRALEPLTGLDVMGARRGGVADRHLTNGPAKACQALGIDRTLDGVDLLGGEAAMQLLDDGMPPPVEPNVGPRIGIRQAVEFPWRFWVPTSSSVSLFRPAKMLPPNNSSGS